jgi:hypothetical protein
MWNHWGYRPGKVTSMDDLETKQGKKPRTSRQPQPRAGRPSRYAPNARVRRPRPGAILSGMSTDSHRIPAKPTLDGLEDTWTQRWARERVVQV